MVTVNTDFELIILLLIKVVMAIRFVQCIFTKLEEYCLIKYNVSLLIFQKKKPSN